MINSTCYYTLVVSFLLLCSLSTLSCTRSSEIQNLPVEQGRYDDEKLIVKEKSRLEHAQEFFKKHWRKLALGAMVITAAGFSIRHLYKRSKNDRDNDTPITPPFVNPTKLFELIQHSTLKNKKMQLDEIKKLKELTLRGGSLESLLPTIQTLENLEKLTIKANNITELPAQITQLKNLKKLTIKNNKLSTLPEGFEKLTNLQSLNLSGNSFTHIPESLTQLSQLKTLDLEYNNFDFKNSENFETFIRSIKTILENGSMPTIHLTKENFTEKQAEEIKKINSETIFLSGLDIDTILAKIISDTLAKESPFLRKFDSKDPIVEKKIKVFSSALEKKFKSFEKEYESKIRDRKILISDFKHKVETFFKSE